MSTFQNSPAGGAIFQPKVWLIDMDDTLYSASAGMFHDIHVLMDDYIVKAPKYAKIIGDFMESPITDYGCITE